MIKKRVYCLLATLLFSTLLFSSCLPVEEATLPAPRLSIPEPALYETDPVIVGEVVLYRDLRANFVPAREEILSFPMNGILLHSVNVRVGDFVREGDIIMELERESYLRELDQTTRDLEAAEVNLRQLEENHALDLHNARLTETTVDMINYTRQHDYYSHQIDVLNIKIENLKRELENRVLRSSMDGYVIFLRRFTEGDVTVADQTMATIADVTETVFLVSDDGADLLNVGDVVEMTVRQEVYYGVIIDPEEYNITTDRSDYEAFILIRDGLQYGFTTACVGNIHVILDVSENVLSVPTRTIHRYYDRTFVFVLHEGLRTLRDIEVGLVGNASTEIVSGLEVGELVIH